MPKKLPISKEKTDSSAIVALVLGILGFMVPFCNILAIVFGFISLNNIKKNPKLEGRSMAITGIVLGFLSIAMFLILLFFILSVIGVVLFSAV